MAAQLKPYLIRRERPCGILYDRVQRQYTFLHAPDMDPWVARPDVEVIDYTAAPSDVEPGAFGAPVALFLDVTSRCQCDCWYCYNHSRRISTKDELTLEEIKILLKRFGQLGGMELRLSGGEPTLRSELLGFIELADEMALRVILVSNGMVADDMLRRLCDAAVTAYYLSIQGDRETHDSIRGEGSYDWCLRTARRLITVGASVRLSMTFHKRNQHCVEDVARVAREIGANVAFNPLRPLGRATPEHMLSAREHRSLVDRVVVLRAKYWDVRIDTPWDFLTRSPASAQAPPYKRIGCGHDGLSVTANGDCFACGQLSTMPSFCVGNVRRLDLADIWLWARRSCALMNAPLAQRCKTCAYLMGSPCFGGCAATAMAVRGRLNGGDPYCFVNLVEGGQQL